MILSKKINKKLVASILILLVLVPSMSFFTLPKKAEAFTHDSFFLKVIAVNTGTTTFNTWKQVLTEVFKQLMMVAVRKILNQLTQATINWINTGNWGNPFYNDRPDQFFKDILKFEVISLIDRIAYDSLHFPFGRAVAGGWVNAYYNPYPNATTWSSIIKDRALIARIRNNFYVGGWNAFFINTQYQENNYLGYLMLANEDLARKINGTIKTPVQKVNETLDRSGGFLEPKMCLTNPLYNNARNEFKPPVFEDEPWEKYRPVPGPGDYTDPDDPNSEYTQAFQDKYNLALANWERTRAINKENFDKKNTCPGGLVTVTPGIVVGNQIKTALESKIRQKELAAALGNSVAQILDTIINKVLEKAGKGLLGLTNHPVDDPGPAWDPRTYENGRPGCFGPVCDYQYGEPGPVGPPGPPPRVPPDGKGGSCLDPDAQAFLSGVQGLYSTLNIDLNIFVVDRTQSVPFVDGLLNTLNGLRGTTFGQKSPVSNFLSDANLAIVDMSQFLLADKFPEAQVQQANALYALTNAAVAFGADPACATPPTTPPGQPPGGSSANWTEGEWRSWFNGVVSQYQNVTTAALQNTRGALNAVGADWQWASDGTLKARMYLNTPNGGPLQGNFSRVVDVSTSSCVPCGNGNWTWIVRNW